MQAILKKVGSPQTMKGNDWKESIILTNLTPNKEPDAIIGSVIMMRS